MASSIGPLPANVGLQAYTTLAAGFRGITWYTYYDRGYRCAAIDRAGQKTPTWNYVAEINRQVSVLASTLCQLSSIVVYFTEPPPVDGLPTSPENLFVSVKSSTPMMIGEFTNSSSERFVMLVNLSLEHSANFALNTKRPDAKVTEISSVDGRPREFSAGKDGHWLPADRPSSLKS